MFESCHTASEVAIVYRRMGFPTVACDFDRVSLIATPALGAVVMSRALGPRIWTRLMTDHERSSAPIVTYPRPNADWVFIVTANRGRPFARSTRDALAARGVRILDAGQRIWLPMSDHATGWHWVSPPIKGMPLPLRSTVLALVCEQLRPLPARCESR
ncbi:hypothetical protein ACFYTQ_35210 [Nocardia sp. NPDC004068]|uniref:hypothetical protein n=1 Tax=Nocardia sp. NPDC004068 TaxID=3364303 RepID=UPI0036B78F14